MDYGYTWDINARAKIWTSRENSVMALHSKIFLPVPRITSCPLRAYFTATIFGLFVNIIAYSFYIYNNYCVGGAWLKCTEHYTQFPHRPGNPAKSCDLWRFCASITVIERLSCFGENFADILITPGFYKHINYNHQIEL